MKKIAFCCFLVSIVGYLISCSFEKKRTDEIVAQTVDSVLYFVKGEISDEILMIHIETYPDYAKSMMINRALSSGKLDHKELISTLLKSINDSVKFKFNRHRYKNVLVYEDRKDSSFLFDDFRYIATISLSNSVSDQKFGYYYFAINCGNKCSGGFLVATELAEGKWRVDKIIQIWKG